MAQQHRSRCRGFAIGAAELVTLRADDVPAVTFEEVKDDERRMPPCVQWLFSKTYYRPESITETAIETDPVQAAGDLREFLSKQMLETWEKAEVEKARGEIERRAKAAVVVAAEPVSPMSDLCQAVVDTADSQYRNERLPNDVDCAQCRYELPPAEPMPNLCQAVVGIVHSQCGNERPQEGLYCEDCAPNISEFHDVTERGRRTAEYRTRAKQAGYHGTVRKSDKEATVAFIQNHCSSNPDSVPRRLTISFLSDVKLKIHPGGPCGRRLKDLHLWFALVHEILGGKSSTAEALAHAARLFYTPRPDYEVWVTQTL